MRNISGDGLAKLANMTGNESILIVEIDWAGTPIAYADKAVAGIPGKILSVNDLENVINLAVSNSQTLSITLDDTDGSIKAILDVNDVHKKNARVYQYFSGLDIEDKFLLFAGKLNSPISWSESERTVQVTINSQLEDREFGFSAEAGDFPFIPKDLIGKPWPSLFGLVLDSPALRVNQAVTGTTLAGVGIISGRDAHLAVPLGQSNCSLGQSLANMSFNISMLDVSAAQWSSVGAGDKAQEMIDRANQLRAQMTDSVNSYGNQQACAAQQRIDTIDEAESQGQGPGIIPILGGEDFPQNTVITLNIGGGLFTGTFQADGFHVQSRRHPENEDKAEVALDKTLDNACTQQQQTTGGLIKVSADGPNGPNAIEYFNVCTDSNKNPTTKQVAQSFWADAGTKVTLADDERITYIVSIVPGTVLAVKAFKDFDGLKRLVDVPADLYDVEVVDYGPVTAVQVVMHKQLSNIIDQHWTDDVYVTFDSDIGPNTVDILKYVIDNYSELTYDSGSFDTVETQVEPFPMSHAVLERANVIEILNQICEAARCAFWIVNGVAHIKYLPVEPDADDTITVDDAFQIEFNITSTEKLVTKLNCDWRLSWADETPERVILRYNIDKYGTQEDDIDLTWFNQPDIVLHSGTFWLIRKSNTWKRLKFKTALHKLNLEVFDCVTLDLPAYVASGPIKALVEIASYNSSDNTIDFECLVPVRLGEMTKYPWFWPATETLTFPSDGSILPTTTQLPIGYTGVIGDPTKPIRYRGEYNNGTAYLVNDAVLFNAETYICFQNTTGHLPNNTVYWRLASSSGQGTIFVGGPNIVFLGRVSGRDLNDGNFTAQPVGVQSVPGNVVTSTRPTLNLELNYAADPVLPVTEQKPSGWPYLIDDGE